MVVDGEIRVTRILPISVTFDHRVVTGGEGARFLRAFIEDLPNGRVEHADRAMSKAVQSGRDRRQACAESLTRRKMTVYLSTFFRNPEKSN